MGSPVNPDPHITKELVELAKTFERRSTASLMYLASALDEELAMRAELEAWRDEEREEELHGV